MWHVVLEKMVSCCEKKGGIKVYARILGKPFDFYVTQNEMTVDVQKATLGSQM